LLSLHEGTLQVVDEVASTPVLVGQPAQDMASLERAMEAMNKRGRAMLCDPILEPIHFGFTESIVRYRDFRAKYPRVPMMMGIGNLTELTDADTAGINALLFGIVSELHIDAVLATEVSPHARSAVREADRARRIMFWAGERNRLPKDVDDGLMNLHERRPFPYTPDEIAEFAAAVKDANYRIQVSEVGVHLYNRDGLITEGDPYDFFPKLAESLGGDAGHAFYLGVELARAHVAWKLGKRYDQDEDLQWGAALPPVVEDLTHQKAMGTTMPLRRKNKGRDPLPEGDGE
jgi:dihydropteroate synthase-like protein